MPTIIVLIGVTGDLARRKLLPAIKALRATGALPEKFELVGVTRRENTDGYFVMDLEDPKDYARFATHLSVIEEKWREPAQRLFYLSVASAVLLPIIKFLGESGLSRVPNTQLLIEKPFGSSYDDAKQLIEEINKQFEPEQQYRVDHYLAKDSVRKLAAHHKGLQSVKYIDILASESLGIERRANFYEQTGALRDVIQSHLLEIAAVLINPNERLRALQDLSISTTKPSTESAVRGQYEGYRAEVSNPASNTETFASVLLESRNDFYTGTIRLTTGKALAEKRTVITLTHIDGTTETIDLSDEKNAYEQVFADAIEGIKTFFVTPEEVLEDWRIVTPVLEAWVSTHEKPPEYRVGTRGLDTF